MRLRFFFVAVLLALLVHSGVSASKPAQTPLDATTIPQFVEDLPDFSVLGRVDGDVPYRVRFEEFRQEILPASFYAGLAPPYSSGTTVFGYGIDQGAKHYPALPRKGMYPGYTIVVSRNHKTTVDYRNDLRPDLEKLLTIDQSIHWANPDSAPMMHGDIGNQAPYAGPVPAVTHLHGAEVSSKYDGGPEEWWLPGNPQQPRGPAYVTNVYHYPNAQEPATLWFHDHALGITRLNVAAGLAAFYLIRGDGDDGLPGMGKLPAARREVELALQDRRFDTNGQLLFPHRPLDVAVRTHPFWVSQFFGDVIVVNGKSWPKLDVTPQRYRLHFLDGASARFFNLQFCVSDAGAPLQVAHGACAPTELKAPFYVIGDDGGMLDAPVKVDHLLISPGERYDVIVDFAPYRGKAVTLRNDALTPYPTGTVKLVPNLQGHVMRFIVAKNDVTDRSYDPESGAPLRGPESTVAPRLAKMVRLPGTIGGLPLHERIADGTEVQAYRQLTLNPAFVSGRCHFPALNGNDPAVELLLNNSTWTGLRHGTQTPIAGAKNVHGVWMTELPRVGSTEIWDLIDMSIDDHPIHIHLVQFQVIARIPYNLAEYGEAYDAAFPHRHCEPGFGPPLPYNVPNSAGALGGNPDVTKFFLKKTQAYCHDDGVYDGMTGPARPEERGWKDTVIVPCGQVTRVVVRIAPQDAPDSANGQPINYTGKNLFPFDPTVGPGYVWHCHVIDHEDNEMMRPWIPVR